MMLFHFHPLINVKLRTFLAPACSRISVACRNVVPVVVYRQKGHILYTLQLR